MPYPRRTAPDLPVVRPRRRKSRRRDANQVLIIGQQAVEAPALVCQRVDALAHPIGRNDRARRRVHFQKRPVGQAVCAGVRPSDRDPQARSVVGDPAPDVTSASRRGAEACVERGGRRG